MGKIPAQASALGSDRDSASRTISLFNGLVSHTHAHTYKQPGIETAGFNERS